MLKRTRTFMYTQQLKHLPFSDIAAFKNRLDNINLTEFAFIIHDKDTQDDGQLIAPHIHAVLRYGNAHTVDSVARQLDDQPQYFEIWQGRYINAYAYLVHRTTGALNKFQYSLSDVTASFDFAERLESFQNKIYKSGDNKEIVNQLLDEIVNGNIQSREDAYRLLPGNLLSKGMTSINAAFSARQVLEAAKWRTEKKKSGEKIHVIWAFGIAGTGKTRFAVDFFKTLNIDYFKSGSSKDPFQGYSGQHGIILDDLRPNEGMTYADLLRFLDPWNLEAMAASRYFDKGLQADYIIITSPLGPTEFYDSLFMDKLDAFDQLTRRLETVLYFDRKSVLECELMTINYKLQYRASHENKIDNRWYVPESEQQNTTLSLNAINELLQGKEDET